MAEKFSGPLSIDPRLRGVTIPPLIVKSSLDTFERMALGVLISHGEVSFPGRQTIADEMGCSLGGARKSLLRLKEKKWIVVESRRTSRGKITSNLYRVCVPDSTAPTGPTTTAPTGPMPGPVRAGLTLIRNQNLNPEGKIQNTAEPVPGPFAPLVKTGSEIAKPPADGGPVGRLLTDFREFMEEKLGRKVVVFYARDGRLFKRLLEAFPEERIVALLKKYVAECERNKSPITVPGFFGAAERLDQDRGGRYGTNR